VCGLLVISLHYTCSKGCEILHVSGAHVKHNINFFAFLSRCWSLFVRNLQKKSVAIHVGKNFAACFAEAGGEDDGGYGKGYNEAHPGAGRPHGRDDKIGANQNAGER
jgi:hypothetical protein